MFQSSSQLQGDSDVAQGTRGGAAGVDGAGDGPVFRARRTRAGGRGASLDRKGISDLPVAVSSWLGRGERPPW